MSHSPRPMRAKFWTPGVVMLAFLMAAGAVAIVARYIGGIGYFFGLKRGQRQAQKRQK